MSSFDAAEGRVQGAGERGAVRGTSAKMVVDVAVGGLEGAASGASLPFERLSLACGPAARLKGLLAQEECGGVLLLAPCRDVHTFGMRRRIDIAFADSAGRVLEAHRFVEPRRRLRCKGAAAVVERFSTAGSPWFVAGDSLELTCERADDAVCGGVRSCSSCPRDAETPGCAGDGPCASCADAWRQPARPDVPKVGVARVRAHVNERMKEGKESA